MNGAHRPSWPTTKLSRNGNSSDSFAGDGVDVVTVVGVSGDVSVLKRASQSGSFATDSRRWGEVQASNPTASPKPALKRPQTPSFPREAEQEDFQPEHNPNIHPFWTRLMEKAGPIRRVTSYDGQESVLSPASAAPTFLSVHRGLDDAHPLSAMTPKHRESSAKRMERLRENEGELLRSASQQLLDSDDGELRLAGGEEASDITEPTPASTPAAKDGDVAGVLALKQLVHELKTELEREKSRRRIAEARTRDLRKKLVVFEAADRAREIGAPQERICMKAMRHMRLSLREGRRQLKEERNEAATLMQALVRRRLAKNRLAQMKAACAVLLRFFRVAFLKKRLAMMRRRVLRKRESTVSTMSSLTRFSNASSKEFGPKTPSGQRSKGFAPRLRVVRKKDKEIHLMSLAFRQLKAVTASRQFFALRICFTNGLANKVKAGYCGDPLRDVSPRELSIGTEVLCRYQDSPMFYEGKISRIRVHGAKRLYDITYEDGDREIGADRFRIRLPGQKQRKLLSVGDFVDARNKARKRFERGIILKVVAGFPDEEPRYDVLFLNDESSTESGVRRQHILGGFTWPTAVDSPSGRRSSAALTMQSLVRPGKGIGKSEDQKSSGSKREVLKLKRKIIDDAYRRSYNLRRRIWRLQAIARGWIARRNAARMRIGHPSPQGRQCIGREVYFRCRDAKPSLFCFRYGIVRDWRASTDTVSVRFYDTNEVLICDRHEVVFSGAQ